MKTLRKQNENPHDVTDEEGEEKERGVLMPPSISCER